MKYLLVAIIFSSLLIQTTSAAEPISPLPQAPTYQMALAKLGKKLFFDPLLSLDKSLSCASCHNFTHGGAEPKPVSIGIKGQKGHMNAPTVLNVRYNFAQFWNGRVEDLEKQSLLPIQNPIEMGLSLPILVQRLNKQAEYTNEFKRVFKESPITSNQIAKALAEYQKALVTPNAKFDRYLRGEVKLTQSEEKGYQLFKSLGCISCHNGQNIGGNSFQKIGVITPYPYTKQQDDRYQLTGRQEDKNRFKVPSLRNVALTAPYFHDGSIENLDSAIIAMGYYNLGLAITASQTKQISDFLHALTGEQPEIMTTDD